MHTEMSARELRAHLTDAHGPEVANAMMARLQPDEVHWEDLATKADLERFATKADLERALTNYPTKADLERALANYATKDQLDAMKHELLAAFRGELNQAVVSQTRMLIWSWFGTTLLFGGMLVTALQLG